MPGPMEVVTVPSNPTVPSERVAIAPGWRWSLSEPRAAAAGPAGAGAPRDAQSAGQSEEALRSETDEEGGLAGDATYGSTDEEGASEAAGSSSSQDERPVYVWGESKVSLSQILDPVLSVHFRNKKMHRFQRARDGSHAVQHHHRKGWPMPQPLTDGTFATAKYWGIKKSQIRALYDECRMDDMWSDDDSVREFVVKFVIPRTSGRGLKMGLALALNKDEPLQISLMISHAWSENAKEFFDDVLANMLDHEVAYICFLSNYQGQPEEIAAQLGNDIHRSPFTEVINNPLCQRLLVVPNKELKSTGEGLYSRLWCIWEIKAAVDAGLPIHIVEDKSAEEYLLGSGQGSSRNARCGDPNLPMNRDERLIRAAVESMPPETSKYQATGLLVVALCFAWGPIADTYVAAQICKHRDCDLNLYSLFLAGLGGGFLVGIFIVFCLVKPTRAIVGHCRKRDGYHVLDEIIRSAARGYYSYRRFRPQRDLPLIMLSGFTFMVMDVVVRWFIFDRRDFEKLGNAALEGLGCGVLFWPCLNINTLGPWTGVYVTSPIKRRLVALMNLFMFVGAGILGRSLGFINAFGHWALMGCLVSFLVISAMWRKWSRALAMLGTIGVMVFTFFHNPYHWRECLVLSFALCAYVTLPELSRCESLFSVAIGFGSIALLNYAHIVVMAADVEEVT